MVVLARGLVYVFPEYWQCGRELVRCDDYLLRLCEKYWEFCSELAAVGEDDCGEDGSYGAGLRRLCVVLKNEIGSYVADAGAPYQCDIR